MSNEDKPMLQMVEIYSGNSPDWKGWHNLCLKNGEDHYAIAGPIEPETSAMILKALDAVPLDLVDALIEVTNKLRESTLFDEASYWYDRQGEAIDDIQKGDRDE